MPGPPELTEATRAVLCEGARRAAAATRDPSSGVLGTVSVHAPMGPLDAVLWARRAGTEAPDPAYGSDV